MYPPHDHTEQMRAITSLQRASARVLALAVAHPEAPSSPSSSSASSASAGTTPPASAPLGTLPWIGEQLNELESAARQLAGAVRAAATASGSASASAAESAAEGASLPTEAELEAVAAECREAIRCAKADAGY
jgi:hypothetical protein